MTSSALAVRGLPMLGLSDEMCMEIILQTPPRHLYKLMQTNKKFKTLCLSGAYWARVVLHLGWFNYDKAAWIPRDMVLLRRPYRSLMEEVIQHVRGDIRLEGYTPEEEIHGTPEQLVRIAQGYPENNDFHYIPSGSDATMYQLAKKYVTDERDLPDAIRRATQGWDVPVAEGFISAERRSTRARSTFLRALEDDPGMDLSTKERVRAYTARLFHDICDRRVGRMTLPPEAPRFTCELFEEDMEACDFRING